MSLFTSSLGLRSMTFSHTSQSECIVFMSSLELRLRTFFTPLSQNATFYIKPGALEHDFFTHLSVRMPRFTSSLELQSMIFHAHLSQNAIVCIKPRAPKHDLFTTLSVRRQFFTSSLALRSMMFSHPSQSECNFLHQAPSSEA